VPNFYLDPSTNRWDLDREFGNLLSCEFPTGPQLFPAWQLTFCGDGNKFAAIEKGIHPNNGPTVEKLLDLFMRESLSVGSVPDLLGAVLADAEVLAPCGVRKDSDG
jgi:hypothetical protein